MISSQLRGHTIVTKLIPRNGFVIDAGAHRGEFANEILEVCGAHVLALEPNADLSRDQPSAEGIAYRPVALGGKSGVARFHLSSQKECSSLLTEAPSQSSVVEVQVVTLEELIAERNVDLDCLKLDIEGAECDVLLSSPENALRACKQITVEFHDFMYPSLCKDVEACKQRLQALGFQCIVLSRKTNEDVLFVRGDIASRMAGELRLVRFVEKYARGIYRMARRSLFDAVAD